MKVSFYPASLQLRVLVEEESLEAANAESLRQAVSARCREGFLAVSLDLGAVQFIDSSGVGVLLALQRENADGIQWRLENVQAPVRTVIEMLRLQHVLRIVS